MALEGFGWIVGSAGFRLLPRFGAELAAVDALSLDAIHTPQMAKLRPRWTDFSCRWADLSCQVEVV